jgi:hypothetical protein
MPDDSNITPSNEDAFKRKFEAIKVDVAALRQRIAEQAAAFSADPAEQRDYRRTLITLLISDALQPLYGHDDDEKRTQVDTVLAKLREEMKERTARRKRIERLLTDLSLAVDDPLDL